MASVSEKVVGSSPFWLWERTRGCQAPLIPTSPLFISSLFHEISRKLTAFPDVKSRDGAEMSSIWNGSWLQLSFKRQISIDFPRIHVPCTHTVFIHSSSAWIVAPHRRTISFPAPVELSRFAWQHQSIQLLSFWSWNVAGLVSGILQLLLNFTGPDTIFKKLFPALFLGSNLACNFVPNYYSRESKWH